jgi:hypothetical protein
MTEQVKRRRGRPPGEGKNDTPHLVKVADLLTANGRLKPTTAMRMVLRSRNDWGSTDETIIRRWQDKWKRGGAALLLAAHERAMPIVAPVSPSHEFDKPFMRPAMGIPSSATMEAMMSGYDSPAMRVLMAGIRNSSVTRAAMGLPDSGAMRAMMGIYDTSTMKAAMGVSETFKAIREFHNSPAAKAMREFHNSPIMKELREAANSPAFKQMREMQESIRKLKGFY